MAAKMQFTNPPPTILPNLSVPPPTVPNLSAPPPTLTMINTAVPYQSRYTNHKDAARGFFKPFRPYHAPKVNAGPQENLQDEFDGKRLRKSVMRKTVDYNSSIIKSLENRIWQRDYRDRRALQPDVIYYPDLLPPPSYIDNPINAVTTKFVKTATNKMRCPIFCMAWTPEGRRLVTGASSGEFTLWNGLTFNFETILQAHDSPVRTMVWSHNESWMVTGDHAGYVKYWQSNMNNVKMFQAHKEAIRGLSFSPTDHKLSTCSDDGTVRIWDFARCHEERILRGHGADVKCVSWHPQKSLVVSGSKDNQQPIKLWDPKTGQSLATLHAHKSTVMDVKWNENGNWLVTASRDHLLKLFDLRNLTQEVQTFRGHKKEASSVAWHPSHEGLFCSGGSDGAILFWHVGADKEVGAIEQAHDSIVWTLAWHPLGHILCSGSNDHTSKFWTRNRPGDLMRDKYNLNTLPAGAGGIDDHEVADEASIIPGMGPEDRINADGETEEKNGEIPGLDLESNPDEKKTANKKVPYSKPIPRNFQAQWNEMDTEDPEQVETLNAIVNQLIETTPGAIPLNDVTPNAIILHGKMIPVEPGSKLAEAISKGTDAINKLVKAGEIEELRDIMDPNKEQSEAEDYLQDEGDIDYSRVPNIALPPPLASSKFAQNPELFKTLNAGGKRKFDQILGWSDGKMNDKVSKIHQPVFGGSFTEDSQTSDVDIGYESSMIDELVPVNSLNDSPIGDFRGSLNRDSRNINMRGQSSENSSFSLSEKMIGAYRDSRDSFSGGDFRQFRSKLSDVNAPRESLSSDAYSWNEEYVTSQKLDSHYSHAGSSSQDRMEGSFYDESSTPHPAHHRNFKMMNVNKGDALYHQNAPNKMSPHPMSDNPKSRLPPHPFLPNSPSPFGPSNFRTPPNPGFPPNMRPRPMEPFANRGAFGGFSRPPPNFPRYPNSNNFH